MLGTVHTITERLIQPYIVNVAECLLDEKSWKKITELLPLFNDLVIQSKDLSVHKKTALISSLQNCTFALKWANLYMCPRFQFPLYVFVQFQHQLIIKELPLCEHNKHKWYWNFQSVQIMISIASFILSPLVWHLFSWYKSNDG